MASKPKKSGKAAPRKTKASSGSSQSWTHGKVFWSELNSHDVEAQKAFYKKSLGWTFEAMPMPGFTYWIIKSGSEVVGGLFELADPKLASVPDHWLTYLAVDNVDKRVKKALTAGGKLVRPAFDVPGVGRIAIIEQPGGAMIGWMTPAEA